MSNPENLILLVKILNKYIYFYTKRIDWISVAEINKLVELIKEHISTIRNEGKTSSASDGMKYFETTLASIQQKKENPDYEELFQNIDA